jgi:hypothetical protein
MTAPSTLPATPSKLAVLVVRLLVVSVAMSAVKHLK